MLNPICSKCIYLLNGDNTKVPPCSIPPIFHKNMFCDNQANAKKDFVTGNFYKPYCEEVNRYGECLSYYPEGLETPSIVYDETENTVTVRGTNPLIVTTDGTDPTAKMEPVGIYDDESELYIASFQAEHTIDVNAVCVLDGVVSDKVTLRIELADVPVITFDNTTNTVTITSYNKVHYTIDGSEVTAESPVYEGPFVIDENVTVKARSIANDTLSEEVSLLCNSIETPVITFDPATNTVTITSDDTVLFSTDGSTIYDDADEYTGPFVITGNCVIKAAALVDGVLSEEASLECQVPTAPTITFDPVKKLVGITGSNPILYTLNGVDVKKKDTVYTEPIKITETTTVKAKEFINNILSEQTVLVCEI